MGADFIEWVPSLPDHILARASRPGYDDERVHPRIVGAWVARVKQLGICSVICLLDDDQLAFYCKLPRGLVEHYRCNGLAAESIRVAECQSPALSQSQLHAVWMAFERLPKPVVVHCSAGISRTGTAVKHIVECLATARRFGKNKVDCSR